MNEYSMLANNYRSLMEKGKLEKEIAEKEIRIFEFLATCDKSDLCRLVDSAAFNDIIRGYIKMALKTADVDEESQKSVIDQLYWLFDSTPASDVLKNYLGRE